MKNISRFLIQLIGLSALLWQMQLAVAAPACQKIFLNQNLKVIQQLAELSVRLDLATAQGDSSFTIGALKNDFQNKLNQAYHVLVRQGQMSDREFHDLIVKETLRIQSDHQVKTDKERERRTQIDLEKPPEFRIVKTLPNLTKTHTTYEKPRFSTDQQTLIFGNTIFNLSLDKSLDKLNTAINSQYGLNGSPEDSKLHSDLAQRFYAVKTQHWGVFLFDTKTQETIRFGQEELFGKNGNFHNLIPGPGHSENGDFIPSLSPDGQKIAIYHNHKDRFVVFDTQTHQKIFDYKMGHDIDQANGIFVTENHVIVSYYKKSYILDLKTRKKSKPINLNPKTFATKDGIITTLQTDDKLTYQLRDKSTLNVIKSIEMIRPTSYWDVDKVEINGNQILIEHSRAGRIGWTEVNFKTGTAKEIAKRLINSDQFELMQISADGSSPYTLHIGSSSSLVQEEIKVKWYHWDQNTKRVFYKLNNDSNLYLAEFESKH